MAKAHVIADSSIWIDHLNKGDAELAGLIRSRRIAVHAMVAGEVLLGSLVNRPLASTEFRKMAQAVVASHDEVMALIESMQLFSRGIGYVDAHLLEQIPFNTHRSRRRRSSWRILLA